MKDGAILANSGHFDIEIDLAALSKLASGERRRQVRPLVEEFLVSQSSGNARIMVIAEGRLVNLGAAEGHPANVMDMSFANQALAAEWAVVNKDSLEPKVYDVPDDIDQGIAALKLQTMGIAIDVLTDRQKEYLTSWHTDT
jgi:adenosylhomocysteinase